MANLNDAIEVDACKVAASINVHLLRLKEFTWRTWLADRLIWLAQWIAPYQIILDKNVALAQLFTCQFCGRQFNEFFLPNKTSTVICPHCDWQMPIKADADSATAIALDGCSHDCSVVKPYGFVPEAGCPVHDPD